MYHAFENQAFQPFIDVRYLILDKGKQGANLGAGLGYQFREENRLSAYAYFDLTDSRTSYLFNQVMGGLSYTHPLRVSGKNLGEMTCYLNGYFPLKSKERVSSPSFAGFTGYNFLLKQTDRYALTGTNLEIGYLSNSWNNWNMYVAASPYYFKRADIHGFGGFGKLRLVYNDLISAEVLVSSDRVFGTNVSGTIGIRIPLGKKGMKAVKSRSCRLHKSRPVERFEPVILKKESKKFIAKDGSGAPLNFVFVNNLSGSDGTFEDPFATLLDAQNNSGMGDIVYVFSGDGTTKGMDQGFTMQEYQTLAGSGASLSVLTDKGVIVIPAHSNNGPIITNDTVDGDGITLISNCKVSGITVEETKRHGFSYDGTEIFRGTFNNCSANKNPIDGFHLISSAGIDSNFSQCNAHDNIANGFSLSSSGRLNSNFSQCHAHNNNPGFSLKTIASSTLPRAKLDSSFSQCSANNNAGGNGFELSSSGELDSSFHQCNAQLNANGFKLTPSEKLNSNFSQCNSDNNLIDGFFLFSPIGLDSSFSECNANNNGSIGGNGFTLTSSSGTSELIMDNCIANSNGQSGDFGFQISSDTLTGKIMSSIADHNLDNGFYLESNVFSPSLILPNSPFPRTIDLLIAP